MNDVKGVKVNDEYFEEDTDVKVKKEKIERWKVGKMETVTEVKGIVHLGRFVSIL